MTLEPLAANSDEEGLLEVGRVTRPHGVRGEVKVQLHWQESEALFEAERVLVRHQDGGQRWLRITGARRANRFVLLRLDGVDSMDAAAVLKGALLSVERGALPPLEADEYYLADLVGAHVRCLDQEIGVVTAVRTYTTVDVLVIETEDGRLLEQPVIDHWIQGVDVQAGLVFLASTEALIE